jgi:hypothetical protein
MDHTQNIQFVNGRPCCHALDVVVLQDPNVCAVPALSSVLEGLACFVMVMGGVWMHCVLPNHWVPSTLNLLHVVLTALLFSLPKINASACDLVHSEFYFLQLLPIAILSVKGVLRQISEHNRI